MNGPSAGPSNGGNAVTIFLQISGIGVWWMAGRTPWRGFSTMARIPSPNGNLMSDSFAWGSVWEDPEDNDLGPDGWPRDQAGPEYWLSLTSGDSIHRCPMCNGTGVIHIVPETR